MNGPADPNVSSHDVPGPTSKPHVGPLGYAPNDEIVEGWIEAYIYSNEFIAHTCAMVCIVTTSWLFEQYLKKLYGDDGVVVELGSEHYIKASVMFHLFDLWNIGLWLLRGAIKGLNRWLLRTV